VHRVPPVEVRPLPVLHAGLAAGGLAARTKEDAMGQ
jgi:hypothetical protein